MKKGFEIKPMNSCGRTDYNSEIVGLVFDNKKIVPITSQITHVLIASDKLKAVEIPSENKLFLTFLFEGWSV